ncbi:MAG: glycosyltransferase [Desulfotomaculales bacterium]
MRVAVFTDSYWPYTSGVVRSISTTIDELAALGCEVFVFAPRYRGVNKENKEKVFRFLALPSPTNPGYNIAIPFSPRLGLTLKRLRVDLVHTHSPFLLGRLGARHGHSLGLPVVFTYHTLYEEYVHYFPFIRSITRSFTKRICVGFCNRVDLVITPTEIITKHISDMGVRTPIKKLPSGIRLGEFTGGNRRWFRERLGIREEEDVLLYVGRVGREKNLLFLLDAYREIVNAWPKARLVLVGGGPELPTIRSVAEEWGLGDRVILAGPVAPADVRHCYAGADVFVFPSLTETQGLVIVEAKAAGLPAVAVRAFGVTEMIVDGADGFLVDLDREVFAKRVLCLLGNPALRHKMAQNARENALNFSAERMARELMRCYETLIENKKSGKLA